MFLGCARAQPSISRLHEETALLLSMTGQGAAHVTERRISVSVEVRTVNSRYFKLALRTSDGYSTIEPRVDEVVRRHIRRGTVQVDIRIDREASPQDFKLNGVAIASYQKQFREIGEQLQLDSVVSLDALLALPGVVDEGLPHRGDDEEDWPPIESALTAALDGLAKMRTGEGRAMAVDLSDNCKCIAGELSSIEARAPLVAEGYRARLTERINKLLEDYQVRVEPTDVIREVGLFAERSDISEEIVRLRSHLEQFDAIMAADESNGRKLEFVTQEMFREANTIGSKANDAEIARHVIELKTAIERIREMIQNVE